MVLSKLRNVWLISLCQGYRTKTWKPKDASPTLTAVTLHFILSNLSSLLAGWPFVQCDMQSEADFRVLVLGDLASSFVSSTTTTARPDGAAAADAATACCNAWCHVVDPLDPASLCRVQVTAAAPPNPFSGASMRMYARAHAVIILYDMRKWTSFDTAITDLLPDAVQHTDDPCPLFVVGSMPDDDECKWSEAVVVVDAGVIARHAQQGIAMLNCTLTGAQPGALAPRDIIAHVIAELKVTIEEELMRSCARMHEAKVGNDGGKDSESDAIDLVSHAPALKAPVNYQWTCAESELRVLLVESILAKEVALLQDALETKQKQLQNIREQYSHVRFCDL